MTPEATDGLNARARADSAFPTAAVAETLASIAGTLAGSARIAALTDGPASGTSMLDAFGDVDLPASAAPQFGARSDIDSAGKIDSNHLDDLGQDYLRRILTARVYEAARKTPLEYANTLSTSTRNRVWLKREDTQPVFSFKLRGAYNKMVNLDAHARAQGVITASAGNHAQGVAFSAARLGIRAVIVVPVTAPKVKVDAVRALGGATVEVVQSGESYSDAYAHAWALGLARGHTFIPAFDDPDVIAGQGTVAMEILSQHPGPLDAIFVPIGGGSLASGVAAYVKAVRPEIKVIGVQTTDSCAMARSLASGERVTLDEVGLFSDGTAVKLVGQETFRVCRAFLDDVRLVDTDALCAAIKDVFQDTRCVLEPAGALAVAGMKQYIGQEGAEDRAFVAIASGANINFDRVSFVAERAEYVEACAKRI